MYRVIGKSILGVFLCLFVGCWEGPSEEALETAKNDPPPQNSALPPEMPALNRDLLGLPEGILTFLNEFPCGPEEVAPPTISLEMIAPSTDEGSQENPTAVRPGEIRLVRNGDDTFDLAIHYLMKGTATEGTDYEIGVSDLKGSPSIVFPEEEHVIYMPAGVKDRRVYVLASEDKGTEPVEGAEFILLAVNETYQVGKPSSAEILIKDTTPASTDLYACNSISGSAGSVACVTPTPTLLLSCPDVLYISSSVSSEDMGSCSYQTGVKSDGKADDQGFAYELQSNVINRTFKLYRDTLCRLDASSIDCQLQKRCVYAGRKQVDVGKFREFVSSYPRYTDQEIYLGIAADETLSTPLRDFFAEQTRRTLREMRALIVIERENSSSPYKIVKEQIIAREYPQAESTYDPTYVDAAFISYYFGGLDGLAYNPDYPFVFVNFNLRSFLRSGADGSLAFEVGSDVVSSKSFVWPPAYAKGAEPYQRSFSLLSAEEKAAGLCGMNPLWSGAYVTTKVTLTDPGM